MSKSQNCTLQIAMVFFFFLISLGGISGCGRKAPELPPPKPPEVEVCIPYPDKVTDYEDFTGRTEAYKMVEVRARAQGYLARVNFKDGEMVDGGPTLSVPWREPTVLFEIDPKPYAIELRRAQFAMEQAEARL